MAQRNFPPFVNGGMRQTSNFKEWGSSLESPQKEKGYLEKTVHWWLPWCCFSTGWSFNSITVFSFVVVDMPSRPDSEPGIQPVCHSVEPAATQRQDRSNGPHTGITSLFVGRWQGINVVGWNCTQLPSSRSTPSTGPFEGGINPILL